MDLRYEWGNKGTEGCRGVGETGIDPIILK